MINELTGIPAKVMTQILNSIGKYKAGGIVIELLEQKGNTITVRVKQSRKDSDVVLTGKELIERGKNALTGIDEYYKVRYRPVVWSGSELENVSSSWVLSKMAKHNLNQKDVVEKLYVDKHVISKLLSNEFAFTRWHKAAFYYLFKSMEGLDQSK